MQIHKNKNKLPYSIIALAIVAMAGGAAFYFLRGNPAQKQTAVTPTTYTGPTQQEQSAGDAQKQAIIDKQTNPSTPATDASGKVVADVVVTDASYYKDSGNDVEVRAYIDNIYEDGGACTATFTQGSASVSVNGSPFKDSTVTQCGAMDLPRSSFPAGGTWQVVVTYSSSTASGSSTQKAVTIE